MEPIKNIFGETVTPQGNIRERIAASIAAGKPSAYSRQRHYEVRLADPLSYFFHTFNKPSRDLREEWADNLLVALDKLGLRIVESDGQESW